MAEAMPSSIYDIKVKVNLVFLFSSFSYHIVYRLLFLSFVEPFFSFLYLKLRKICSMQNLRKCLHSCKHKLCVASSSFFFYFLGCLLIRILERIE
jgi:hypothetical protein